VVVYALPVALVVAVLVLAAVADLARQRAKILRRVRAEWGRRCDRVRDFDRMLSAHRSRCDATGDETLGDRTWDDLDLDALFAYLDRTESTLGQEALYHRLRRRLGSDDLIVFDGLVTRLQDDRATREAMQVALARLQEPNGYNLWWIAGPGAFDTPRWYVVFPLLSVAAVGTVVSSVLWTGSVVAVVIAVWVNAMVRLATDRRISLQANAFGRVAPLIATGRSLRILRGGDIAATMEMLRQDLKRLRGLALVAGLVSGDAFAASRDATLFKMMTRDFAASAYHVLNTVFLLDGNAVWLGATQVRAQGAVLLRLMATIGDIDAAIAVASCRDGTEVWTRPRFRPSAGPIVIDDLRHPLIQDAVANSIVLAPPHGVLVTGCNMAGKSYYAVEVETLLECVRLAMRQEPCLFLIDELFRGTNAAERIAAGEAVLIELIGGANGRQPHVVIAATHDGALADMLDGLYESVHFGGVIGSDGMGFDYRLRPGRARTRNAIALLKHFGAPEGLVERALQRVGTLEG